MKTPLFSFEGLGNFSWMPIRDTTGKHTRKKSPVAAHCCWVGPRNDACLSRPTQNMLARWPLHARALAIGKDFAHGAHSDWL